MTRRLLPLLELRGAKWLGALIALILVGCPDDPEPPPPPCMTHADCAGEQMCTMDGQCVDGAECTIDTDCGDPRRFCNQETFECNHHEGFADECDAARPCAFGQFCSTLLGRCLDATGARDCIRRSQCPAAQICDRNSNKCVPDPGCYGNQFCDDGEICDLDNNVCRALAVECTPCRGAMMTCEGGALCHVDTKECVQGGADPTCSTGEFCDPLGRCVQCTTNAQCGPGLYCNVALGRCDSNTQCANDASECPDSANVMCVVCNAPLICNARTKRCEAPPMECDNDVDCPGDHFCDLTLDPPICIPRIPDCLNDLLDEPRNDRAPQARLLEAADGPSFDDLKVCQGDVDWYRLEIAAGTYLTIDTRFDHDDGDLDVQLFLDDGRTLLDESRTTTNNERVELEVGTDRVLLVKVFLAVPAIQPVTYRLIVARDDGTLCADDDNEPDDFVGDGKPLVTDVPYEGRLCTADPDWFMLRGVTAGQTITARLDFVDSLGDLDLELYRAGSVAPIQSATSVDDDEILSYDASFGGDYFLKVFGKAADTNVYTVRAELRDNAMAFCRDDDLEPDNTVAEATAAPEDTGDVKNLSLCSGDEDWFLVNLGPDESMRAEIGFEPSADLEMKLYPPGGEPGITPPLKSSIGFNTIEYIGYRAASGGDYLLRVHGLDQRAVSPYTFRIVRDPPFICEPDMVDMMGRGTSQMDAFALPQAPSRLDDLTICAGDTDWYQLFLPGGFRHAMRIHYLGSDGQLDIAITDATGAQLAATAGAGDFKEVAGNVPGFGVATLFMRVFSTTGGESRYSVVVDSVPLYTCRNDRDEINDELTLATPVVLTSSVAPYEPVEFPDQTLCATSPNAGTGQGDQDWYRIDAPHRGARIEATLEHETGDLFLELFSPGINPKRACLNLGADRCYSDGMGLEESIAFTATTATVAYHLRVGSIFGNPGVQVRPTDADTPYSLRIAFTSTITQ